MKFSTTGNMIHEKNGDVNTLRPARIGVGVTTYNRPECLAKWKEQIAKHTFMDNVLIYVAEDTDQDRQGVAKRKNECLRALKDCDFIFLFDEDCWPIKDGWVDFFINRKPEEHVLFLNDRLHNPICTIDDITTYNDAGGCFMFMNRDLIKWVGAFNEKFNIYGFEHVEWSMRAANNHREFLMYVGTEQYLYSEDYSNPNHKSSITDEEKKMHVRNNWDKFFKEPIKDIYIPL